MLTPNKRADAGDILNSRTNLSLRQLRHVCLPFSKERKYDRHVLHLPHSICCSVFPRCALKGRKWMWYLCTSQSYSVLWWFRSPHTVTHTPPPPLSSRCNPPGLEKKGGKFKAFLSAGICLCTPNVQSMTLSLIIHVTTSWAVRALALTPPNHYGATGLMEESTLISSEESNGDIFQPLCSSPHSPALTPLSSLLLTPPGERL